MTWRKSSINAFLWPMLSPSTYIFSHGIKLSYNYFFQQIPIFLKFSVKHHQIWCIVVPYLPQKLNYRTTEVLLTAFTFEWKLEESIFAICNSNSRDGQILTSLVVGCQFTFHWYFLCPINRKNLSHIIASGQCYKRMLLLQLWLTVV